jgi:response regulator RpfG family c-di-GMP phosphodiesterase
MESARELLGMDMAYIADTRNGRQDYRLVTGDGESFGARESESVPLEGTYCELLLSDELTSIVRDAGSDARVCSLPITERAGIGSYIGVPLVLPGGEVYGTFCCLSHAPSPALRERDARFLEVLARMIAEQLRRSELEAESRRAAVTDAKVTALLAALAARDGYTGEHSAAVVDLAVTVARRLGVPERSLEDVANAALLHDIGKIGISDAVLRKPGALTAEEWSEMRRHPEVGARIVASMPGLTHLAPAIRAEHERWDGGGYPDGLAGEAIPLASRIVLACDAYHAITSDRPYRAAMTHEHALGELVRHAGAQFCPRTVAAAVAVLSGPA